MKKLLFSIITIALIFSGAKAKAAFDLPSVLVGQTTLSYTADGQTMTYYGGFQGNEAIINYYPDVLVGFSTTDPTNNILSCNLKYSQPCFLKEQKPNIDTGVKVMRARSYVGDASEPKLEIAALFYPPRTIIGDAFANTDLLSNFKFWGKSLAQSSGEDASNLSDALWRVGKYPLNPNAQVSIKSEDFAKQGKIKLLAKEAAPVNSTTLNSWDQWNMNCSNIIDDSCSSTGSTETYPEGKVWYVPNTLIIRKTVLTGRTVKYKGKGTIIVQGDLIIEKDVTIEQFDEDSRLGFIVLRKDAF